MDTSIIGAGYNIERDRWEDGNGEPLSVTPFGGWYPCPCCDGNGGSNLAPLPDHDAEIARLKAHSQSPG